MQKRVAAALLALFAVVYLAPLGIRPLYETDEFRYAEIPREMVASGDWVVPRLDGMRYFEKPALGYWLTASSMVFFGQNPFGVRLPVALSAGGAALALFLLVRRSSSAEAAENRPGGVGAAAAAAGILLTSFMFYTLGCYSTLDMPLTMFLTAAAVLFYFAFETENPRRKVLCLLFFGVAVGCAFLTKGFLVFAFLCAAGVPFMLWERRTGKLLRLAWLPLLTMALVALPWCLMIHRREPDFWSQFFWEQHWRRFWSGRAQHAQPAWFFIPWIVAGILPWTALAPAAIIGLGKEKLKDPLIRFALCWLVFPFLFFSVCSGKLPTYILPCFPPLALLIGVGLHRYFDQGRGKAFVAGAWAVILLLDVAMVAIVAVSATGGEILAGPLAEARQFFYRPNEQWKWLLLISALVVWAALWFWGSRPSVAVHRLALLCAGPCLFMVAENCVMPQAAQDFCAPEAFLARDSARVEAGAPLLARAGLTHAVAWHYKRTDVILLDSEGEFEYGLLHSNDKNREVELDDFASFVAKYPPTKLITVLVEKEYYQDHQARLPKAEYVDMNAAFVFAQYRGTAR
ncbi:MAG: phospholipid carrier-dependent glycosyltransferase [Candidatus Brocadiia bacterium]|jgi:4-amino-4-deoxy-L-arabinose transferase